MTSSYHTLLNSFEGHRMVAIWEKDGVVLYACDCGDFHHYKPRRGNSDELWTRLNLQHVKLWLWQIHTNSQRWRFNNGEPPYWYFRQPRVTA